MEVSDKHLETMLEDFNGRVCQLEDEGDPHDLMHAYVNRGTVLLMMGYRTSAMEDMENALEIAENLGDIDAGTFVRIHASMGSILFDEGDDPSEEYWLASTRLKEVGRDSVHFDARSLIRTCISVAEDLVDSGHPEDCDPFLSKALEVLSGNDQWSRNRRVDVWNLSGEADDDSNDPASAVSSYTAAIDEAVSLMKDGMLEDPSSLVLALSMRAAARADLHDDEDAVSDLDAAVSLLEGMLEHHGLPDTEPLVALHHDLAGALMRIGRTEEAERHLIRAMEIEVSRSVSGSSGERT